MDRRGFDLKNLEELLTLPGNGVFTVHTGKEKKENLLRSYYGTTSLEKARLKWLRNIDSLKSDKPFILGIPSDNGGGIHRGANWGPLTIRQEIVDIKNDFIDLGDIRVIPHLLHDKYLNKETILACRKALYGKNKQLPVSPLSIAEEALKTLYASNHSIRILGLGGDHSTSYPLVKSWLETRKNLKEVAVLHFDAHTDLLSSRLGIDLCFGTWTFHILNSLYSRSHILQVGIRSSGKTKKYWKENLGVEQIWASEVRKNGANKTLKKISSYFKNLGIKELYISFDIDALDEKYASATGTPEKGGLTPTDCASIIRMLSHEIKITGADLMEVAPHVIPDGVNRREHKSSITVAGDIAKILLESMQ